MTEEELSGRNGTPSNHAVGVTRDDLAFEYIEHLQFTPYPFQEEAIFAWFSSRQGVLVCAPTGMGKTLIAEAGLFEALKTGTRAYYTTPLIALTEQKYREIQDAVVRWGFSRNDVGLVTGNRRENPDAKILVVVAEILFNRLLLQDGAKGEVASKEEGVDDNAKENTSYSFDDVSVVVMDEFHSFNDYERGIVWEFSLGLLPEHVRTLLISATVGNAYEFVSWLRDTAKRTLMMVQSDERKVPLTYRWVGDELLTEQLEKMCRE
ncbi:MAG: DEAD/DEAH box helicase, partial [Planctomycetaceae bacterium]|nr:DEAD/DEAH box helicase [Planctomycetaceae bacterium]